MPRSMKGLRRRVAGGRGRADVVRDVGGMTMGSEHTKSRPKARYYTPGSFFSEDSSVELSDRSVGAAIARAPQHAFAFILYDSPICDFEFDAGRFKVIPIPQNESAKHYIGGKVFTVDELHALAVEEGDPAKYRTLIANVEGNGWGRAIRCGTGNWQPFEEGDVLVEVDGV